MDSKQNLQCLKTLEIDFWIMLLTSESNLHITVALEKLYFLKNHKPEMLPLPLCTAYKIHVVGFLKKYYKINGVYILFQKSSLLCILFYCKSIRNVTTI